MFTRVQLTQIPLIILLHLIPLGPVPAASHRQYLTFIGVALGLLPFDEHTELTLHLVGEFEGNVVAIRLDQLPSSVITPCSLDLLDAGQYQYFRFQVFIVKVLFFNLYSFLNFPDIMDQHPLLFQHR